MFDNSDFSKSLGEDVFDTWLENGRQNKLNPNYLLIIWDELESEYKPVYVERREEIYGYTTALSGESLVAAYDLYSESRIV